MKDGDHVLSKRSVVLAGHATSVSLEGAFWRLLKGYARADGISLNALVTRIDAERPGNLSSALRVYCLTRLAAAARLNAG